MYAINYSFERRRANGDDNIRSFKFSECLMLDPNYIVASSGKLAASKRIGVCRKQGGCGHAVRIHGRMMDSGRVHGCRTLLVVPDGIVPKWAKGRRVCSQQKIEN